MAIMTYSAVGGRAGGDVGRAAAPTACLARTTGVLLLLPGRLRGLATLMSGPVVLGCLDVDQGGLEQAPGGGQRPDARIHGRSRLPGPCPNRGIGPKTTSRIPPRGRPGLGTHHPARFTWDGPVDGRVVHGAGRLRRDSGPAALASVSRPFRETPARSASLPATCAAAVRSGSAERGPAQVPHGRQPLLVVHRRRRLSRRIRRAVRLVHHHQVPHVLRRPVGAVERCDQHGQRCAGGQRRVTGSLPHLGESSTVVACMAMAVMNERAWIRDKGA
jgi:hypothetical protein